MVGFYDKTAHKLRHGDTIQALTESWQGLRPKVEVFNLQKERPLLKGEGCKEWEWGSSRPHQVGPPSR